MCVCSASLDARNMAPLAGGVVVGSSSQNSREIKLPNKPHMMKCNISAIRTLILFKPDKPNINGLYSIFSMFKTFYTSCF